MNKKVLFVCTYADFLVSFELNNINEYIKRGYEVHCAANITKKEYNKKIDRLVSLGVKIHNVDFPRKPLSFQFFKAYKQIKKVIREENITVIDTHNPVSSVISRLAAKKLKIKTAIYTAHGLSFWKGAPLLNRLIFKHIEKRLSKYTDLIVCINKEDYEYATKHFKVRKEVVYIPGIGINTTKINSAELNMSFRESIGVPENAILLLSVGEMIPRKNHALVIEAISKLNNANIYYSIIGLGYLKNELKEYADKLGVSDKVKFAGYRTDIYNTLKSCDLFIFPSRAEGLPVALMEAIASPCICVASNIRGNVDLIDESTGFLFIDNDVESLKKAISNALSLSNKEKETMLEECKTRIKDFDEAVVKDKMSKVYDQFI